jgi:hypothetical protein
MCALQGGDREYAEGAFWQAGAWAEGSELETGAGCMDNNTLYLEGHGN